MRWALITGVQTLLNPHNMKAAAFLHSEPKPEFQVQLSKGVRQPTSGECSAHSHTLAAVIQMIGSALQWWNLQLEHCIACHSCSVGWQVVVLRVWCLYFCLWDSHLSPQPTLLRAFRHRLLCHAQLADVPLSPALYYPATLKAWAVKDFHCS